MCAMFSPIIEMLRRYVDRIACAVNATLLNAGNEHKHMDQTLKARNGEPQTRTTMRQA